MSTAKIFYQNNIVSITHCPHGVRNTNTQNLITRDAASIIETPTKSFVILKPVSFNGGLTIRIEHEFVHEEKEKSRKSDFRPHKREIGDSYVSINQNFIYTLDTSDVGILDLNVPIQKFQNLPIATIIETITKSYIVRDIIDPDPSSKFIDIPVTAIIDTASTKKANYVVNR